MTAEQRQTVAEAMAQAREGAFRQSMNASEALAAFAAIDRVESRVVALLGAR